MADRGTVGAPDPFKTDGGNPRQWLVVSGERMPSPDEFTEQATSAAISSVDNSEASDSA